MERVRKEGARKGDGVEVVESEGGERWRVKGRREWGLMEKGGSGGG